MLNNINWTTKEYDELICHLKEIGDKKYKEFHQNLVPGINNIIGIQIPKLRAMAKEIAKGNYNQYLSLAKNEYYEEIMLRGLVIGYVKTNYDDTLILIKSFLPHINNWAICDSFCKKFGAIKNNKEEFLLFLKDCIKSNNEYYIRFAIIMLKTVYIDNNIDTVLTILDDVKHDGYYVKMAIAWTLCDCFIKFKDKTMNYLNSNNLDNFTYNKTLQKILESNRVDNETKDIIRNMKKK